MLISQIRFFLAVVDSGSMRAAARKLGVSSPAITKSLRRLEAELHTRLLERTQHGVVPTPAGRSFVVRARIVQSELRQAEEDLAQFTGGPAGSVAFGAGLTLMFLVVPEALAQFRRMYPDARVRIVEGMSSAILPMVRDETLDFALVVRPVGKPEPGLRFRPLLHDTLAIAVRKGHPLRNERSLLGLMDAEWLALAPNWVTPALARVFSAAGLKAPRSVTHCDTFISVFALLATTDLIAAIPRRLLLSPFARGVVQQVAVAERMPSFTLCLVTRTDAPLTRMASAMVKIVIAIARQIARHGNAE